MKRVVVVFLLGWALGASSLRCEVLDSPTPTATATATATAVGDLADLEAGVHELNAFVVMLLGAVVALAVVTRL